MRRLVGPVVALACAALACAALPAPAQAHSELIGSSPAPGQQVAPGLSVVELTFLGLREDGPWEVTVTTEPDGATVPISEPVLVEESMLCAAVEPLSPGIYAISYQAVSNDGHDITGRFLFEVADTGDVPDDPLPCQEVAVPAPVANPGPAGGGSSVAGWLSWLAASGAAAALLLALVGAGLVVRARRRQALR